MTRPLIALFLTSALLLGCAWLPLVRFADEPMHGSPLFIQEQTLQQLVAAGRTTDEVRGVLGEPLASIPAFDGTAYGYERCAVGRPWELGIQMFEFSAIPLVGPSSEQIRQCEYIAIWFDSNGRARKAAVDMTEEAIVRPTASIVQTTPTPLAGGDSITDVLAPTPNSNDWVCYSNPGDHLLLYPCPASKQAHGPVTPNLQSVQIEAPSPSSDAAPSIPSRLRDLIMAEGSHSKSKHSVAVRNPE